MDTICMMIIEMEMKMSVSIEMKKVQQMDLHFGP